MIILKNVLWGILFILVGVILGLNSFGVTDIDLFFDGWWTLFIIVPCFIDLFTEKSKTSNMIGVVIGGLLLLSCQGVINFEVVFKLLIPTILVMIGLSFIFKNVKFNGIQDKMKKENQDSQEKLEYCATFSGQQLDFSNEKFKGCELSAVFGGIRCDLSKAIIEEDVVLNVSAIFGGIDIIVPNDVLVKVNSTAIFGGTSDKARKNMDSKVTIYVNATCLFGGVEIK